MLDFLAEEDADQPTKGIRLVRIDWWCDLADDARTKGKWSQRKLAAEVSARLRRKVAQTSIMRCIDGSTMPLELVEAISAVLHIPPPIILPGSPEEALALIGALQLHRVRRRVADLKDQVSGKATPPGQSEPIPSVTDGDVRRERGRALRAADRTPKA
jgi:hypothetical protein